MGEGNKSKQVSKLWPEYFKYKSKETKKQLITHEHLMEQGFVVNGIDEYFQAKTGITVYRQTTKTGKEMFTCNGRILKYMIELYS